MFEIIKSSMTPDTCPKCKEVHYWDRELDLDEEENGLIRERWHCYNFECDYVTPWFDFICKKIADKNKKKDAK